MPYMGKTGCEDDLAAASAARPPRPPGGDFLRATTLRPAGTALLDKGAPTMAWFILFIAGLMEIGWAIGLKYTEGFTRLVPSAVTLVLMTASVVLLAIALKTLPVGTGYAVWTGIGAVGTAILGIVLFGDPATAARLASIGLIVAGIVGLKLVS